jgi:hypothetical protein
MRILLITVFITFSALAAPLGMSAQGRGAPPGPPPTAKAAAPADLTGYWVSYVTEDWRFRMVTPAKGDYQGVPLNEQGRKTADAWNPASDEAPGNACKPYGAGAIMRMPSRFHITWQDDNTLKVDSDAGMQTRLFHFNSSPAQPGQRTLQGYSSALWQAPALKVTTTNLNGGYLRKNGVPYGESATVTEYFDTAPLANNGQVLLVTTIVDDPQYLQQPFIVSSQFKKEADGSKWDPTPCTAR